MVWSWFSSEKQRREGVAGAVAAVRFLGRAVVATMGCFFGCFGVKDSQAQSVSPPEPVVSRNKKSLSSLLVSDDDSLGKEEEGLNSQYEVDFKELKEQARYLKACGTIAETPIEIRKASERLVDISSQNGEQKYLNFNSWFPNASIEKLDLDKQPVDSPQPVKICEGVADSVEDTPTSCLTDGLTRRQSTSSDLQSIFTPNDEQHNDFGASLVSPGALPPTAQFKNKSVRFDCESDKSPYSSKGSTSESASQHSKGSGGHFSLSKPSINPTPLKLTDEMQTPGTVFPGYLDNLAHGKTTRVRSQFVYPVSSPVETLRPWEEIKDKHSDFNDLIGSHNLNDEATPKSLSMLDMSMKDVAVGKEMKDEASLGSSSKLPSSKQDEDKKLSGSSSGENVISRKASSDRPILGMVAAHWNDDETSRISPKWWDGNGIPNSTNKYKEDQKVSWHATPFEERLEKALSEETFISKRKPISGTQVPDFNDTEESDTALSHLKSSTHFNSVVSF